MFEKQKYEKTYERHGDFGVLSELIYDNLNAAITAHRNNVNEE